MFTSKFTKKAKRMASVVVALLLLLNQTTYSFAQALPGNPTVAEGQATFNYSADGQQLIVNQLTPNVRIQWQNFDIGAGSRVVYQQLSSQSQAWNIVTGGSVSQLLGSLLANGFFALINPAGIFIGPGATINAAGFLASTLNIQDVMRNDSLQKTIYNLQKGINGNAVIINHGTIEVTDGGQITLVGGAVQNMQDGVILAKLGKVNMAAGEQVALTVDDAGIMSVAIDQPVGSSVSGVTAPLSNLGQIIADGGLVTLSAKTLQNVFQYAINNEGVIKADALVSKNGEIYLTANDKVNVGGTISAKGGKVAVDSVGADYHGTINSAIGIFNAHDGDTTISGSYSGNKTFLDNGNIAVTGNLTITGGDLTIEANADNTGDSGDVTQNAGTAISGDQNVTIEGDNLYLKRVIFGTSFTGLAKSGEMVVNWLNGSGDVNLTANGDGATKNDVTIVGNIDTAGNVQIDSLQGNIVHDYGSTVMTSGGNFRGNAANDYILYGGSLIYTGSGTIDIKAGRDIYLGTSADKFLFDWDYVSGSRSYLFKEFGYYVHDGSSIVRYALVSGTDIGKDGVSTGSGVFTLNASDPLLLYGDFSMWNGAPSFTVYQEAGLNSDNQPHVLPYPLGNPASSEVGFEDTLVGSDYDYNDAVINIPFTRLHGATLSGGDVYLTAVTGGIHQVGGDIIATNLMTNTNTGMEGSGSNGGLLVTVGNISALNRGLGDILFDNKVDLVLQDLTGKTGLNSGVTGTNGVENQGSGGKIDIMSQGNLFVDAPVTSTAGDINLTATDNLSQSAAGDVTINQIDATLLNAPTNVHSVSHETNTWQFGVSNDNTVDVMWDLPDVNPEAAKYTATAGGTYTMESGAEVKTNGGEVTITAEGDVTITKVDAGNAVVNITSNTGNLIDGDPLLSNDVDVIGHTLNLSAAGTVDLDASGPNIGFSLVWDQSAGTVPGATPLGPMGYETITDSGTYDLSFGATSPELPDGINNYFHIVTTDGTNTSSAVHLGAFYIDTTAPTISADRTAANGYGWNNTDVTVHYNVDDALSGVLDAPPSDYGDDIVTTEGAGQSTSGIVYDRAGNSATATVEDINIDKTAPDITAIRDTAANGHGWNNTNVDTHYDASDALSGLVDPATGTFTFTSEGSGQSHTFTVTDKAGNSASASIEGVNIDKTAPNVTVGSETGTQNPDGTWSTNVDVSFDATDGLSGLEPEGAKSVTGFSSGTTDGPGSGLTVTSESICDLAGNCSVGIAGPYTVISSNPTPTNVFGLIGDEFRFKIPAKSFTENYVISATQGPITFITPQVYFYHPLTEVGGYQAPELNMDMYNFIDGNISVTNPALLPIQLDERKGLPLVK